MISGAATGLAAQSVLMPTPQEILNQLKQVKYPGFTRDIVSFGLIKDIEVASSGVTVVLTAASAKPEVVDEIAGAVQRTVSAMAGVPHVKIALEQAPSPRMAAAALNRKPIPGVRHVVAVASGKGGVGKSTVAVNLALAMASLGWRIGLMDADVYGPSVAMMLGGAGESASRGQSQSAGESASGGARAQVRVTDQRRIVPLERFGLRYISMALFINDETPVIWRGPMVTKLESDFLFNVEWGDLDCLVLDLPPGTGDAQLTITQRVALAGGVIVTTPQDIALLDVKRGVTMFQEVGVAVLGVVENMSYHLCRKCGHRHEIFSHGGGARFAQALDVPFLGELPLVRELREGGDTARPLVTAYPDHPVTATMRAIAGAIIRRLDQNGARKPV